MSGIRSGPDPASSAWRLPNPAEPIDVAYFALHDSPRLRSYRLIYHSPAYLIYGLSARLEPRRG